MAVSENFTGKNYWGLVQQNGPWRMTSQDVANQRNAPITPGPGGTGQYPNNDMTLSFNDQYSRVGNQNTNPSHYTQFSIVSGHGRSFTPFNAGNPEKQDSLYGDPQSALNIEGNAFGVSLNNEWAPKPLYPKATAFVTEDFLVEQALKQEAAPTVQLDQVTQEALAEDFYDTVLAGHSPMRAKVERQSTREGNLQKSLTQTPGELIYSENYLPPRKDLILQNLEIHQSFQPREDNIIDTQAAAYNYQQGIIEQSLDPDRGVF